MLLFLLLIQRQLSAQQATVRGIITDEDDKPVNRASILVLGRQQGITSNDSGRFVLSAPSQRSFALVFSATGFQSEQRNFYLAAGEEKDISVMLTRDTMTLQEVIVKDEAERKETGLIRIDPQSASQLPSVTGGVEGLLKILVGSNNELSSQYAVRGGNFDENLIYINDFEIYRPYLVRSGQQEGLSFINPALIKNIRFYTGGFQAKYGDKMSSVLDIEYRNPRAVAASVYAGLLEQGLHVEGISRDKKFTWLAGVRSKTNRSLLGSQEVKGAYLPAAADLQALLSYKLSDRWQVDLLAIFSRTGFSMIPESARKSSAVFSPLFTANVGLDIYFEGREEDTYRNALIGVTATQKVNNKLTLKWMAGRFEDHEKEHFDITGAYLFGERNFDQSSAEFGQIINPMAAGVNQRFARNDLDIIVNQFSHKGTWNMRRNYIQWGAGISRVNITDHTNEWEYNDSAGYSLPFDQQSLQLNAVMKNHTSLAYYKIDGYLQDNIRIAAGESDISLQGGVRFNYHTFTRELLVSPRLQMSFKPGWKHDVVFKASAGLYDQPPFYREMKRPDGRINDNAISQRSAQFVTGFDYSWLIRHRPFRLTAEAYYKSLWNVAPYDMDNVRIRYLGNNNAKAYAMGLETRLYTELVKDAESWFSIAISRTKENLEGDHYYRYKNRSGEWINAESTDQLIADSARYDMGYLRRPTDRLITAGLFLQDYLSTNKNFKVHLNMIYGSNMTYNIPGNARYRNALIIEPYMRVDLGFSASLLTERTKRRSHSPFRKFESIVATLEIFNLIDRANTISYQLVKDFANNTFSIPNRLTPRLLNFELAAKF